MKISVITVVFNGERTIEETILSVAGQTHHDVEHIIVDGASTDRTMQIVQKHRTKLAEVISEPDNGIYDAMNRGLRCASGDVVGFLNADDTFASDDVLARIAQAHEDDALDVCFGDLVFVKPNNRERVVRYYSSKGYSSKWLRCGMMPAHPTLYIKRRAYEVFGGFKPKYRIAGDFELLVRFLGVEKLHYLYLPRVMVKMNVGGVSTKSWKSNVLLNQEIQRACDENGIHTNLVLIYSKYFRKIFQVLHRP